MVYGSQVVYRNQAQKFFNIPPEEDWFLHILYVKRGLMTKRACPLSIFYFNATVAAAISIKTRVNAVFSMHAQCAVTSDKEFISYLINFRLTVITN